MHYKVFITQDTDYPKPKHTDTKWKTCNLYFTIVLQQRNNALKVYSFMCDTKPNKISVEI